MQPKFGSVGALVLAATVGTLWAGEPLKLGARLPAADVQMENVDGKQVSLKDVQGAKGTLVVFACNHCPFVKAWQSRLVALGNACREKGLGVILINANDPAQYAEDDLATMKQVAAREGYRFPYACDARSAIARAFGATRTPEAFLFNAEATLVYHGTVDDNPYKPDQVKQHYLQDAVDALLSGKEIAEKETKALGCSIKLRPEK